MNAPISIPAGMIDEAMSEDRRFSGFDFRRAINAVKALVADPDDTAQAFRVVDALPGGAPKRNLKRFRATRLGAKVLADKRSLMEALMDRQRLEALPEDSVGRAYLRFMDAEAITADGLVEASIEGAGRARHASVATTDHEVFDTWLRDSHDLWHTVTGYQGDLVGEAALLAFSFAQTRHPGVGLIVLAALLRTSFLGRVLGPEPNPEAEPNDDAPAEVRRMIVQGFMRGLRAEWLPAQDWEHLLSQPLAQTRRALRLGDAPTYTPIRSSEIASMNHAAA